MPTIKMIFNPKTDADFLIGVDAGRSVPDLDTLKAAAKKQLLVEAEKQLAKLNKFGASSMEALGLKMPSIDESKIDGIVAKMRMEAVTKGYPNTGEKGIDMATNFSPDLVNDSEIMNAIHDVLIFAIANKTLVLTIPEKRAGETKAMWHADYQEHKYDDDAEVWKSTWKKETVEENDDDPSSTVWRVEDLVANVLANNDVEMLQRARENDGVRNGLVKLIAALREHVELDARIEQLASQLDAMTAGVDVAEAVEYAAGAQEEETEDVGEAREEEYAEHAQEDLEEDELQHGEEYGKSPVVFSKMASSSASTVNPFEYTGQSAAATKGEGLFTGASSGAKRRQDETVFGEDSLFFSSRLGSSPNSKLENPFDQFGDSEVKATQLAINANTTLVFPTATVPYTVLSINLPQGMEHFVVDAVSYTAHDGSLVVLDLDNKDDLDALLTFPKEAMEAAITNISFHDREVPTLQREIAKDQTGGWLEQVVISGNTFKYKIPNTENEVRSLTVEFADGEGVYPVESISGNTLTLKSTDGNFDEEIEVDNYSDGKWLETVGAELKKPQASFKA